MKEQGGTIEVATQDMTGLVAPTVMGTPERAAALAAAVLDA